MSDDWAPRKPRPSEAEGGKDVIQSLSGRHPVTLYLLYWAIGTQAVRDVAWLLVNLGGHWPMYFPFRIPMRSLLILTVLLLYGCFASAWVSLTIDKAEVYKYTNNVEIKVYPNVSQLSGTGNVEYTTSHNLENSRISLRCEARSGSFVAPSVVGAYLSIGGLAKGSYEIVDEVSGRVIGSVTIE